MTIVDCPILGKSASELNFNDDSGSSLHASGLIVFIPSFFPPLGD
jgi:hypothetical protein